MWRATLLLILPVLLARAEPPLEPDGPRLGALSELLASRSTADRERALVALGRIDGKRAGQMLRRSLESERDPGLRRLAGFSLAGRHCLEYYRALRGFVKTRDKGRVADLISHAISEPARFLRALDLWAALQLDPAATRRELVTALKREKDVPRLLRAAELMGLCGREADDRPLRALIAHKDRYLRVEVLLALGKLRHADCDALLAKRAIEDPHPQPRRFAVWALFERGGLIGLRAAMAPYRQAAEHRQRAALALDIRKLRDPAEEGPLAFRYEGKLASVLDIFRRAEMGRAARIDAPADVKKRLEAAYARLAKASPPLAFFARYAFVRIASDPDETTGTFIYTGVFNIQPATARRWSVEFLAKTLVHDATHAYLYLMGEKSGEYRGEMECFQEAYWAGVALHGERGRDYTAEVDKLLREAHWTRRRTY